jgi:hypothetical protein
MGGRRDPGADPGADDAAAQACFTKCIANDANAKKIAQDDMTCSTKCTSETDDACMTDCDTKFDAACNQDQASCDLLNSCADGCFPKDPSGPSSSASGTSGGVGPNGQGFADCGDQDQDGFGDCDAPLMRDRFGSTPSSSDPLP